MNRLATERHLLGVDLRHTIKRNELLLYFQPVIDRSFVRDIATDPDDTAIISAIIGMRAT